MMQNNDPWAEFDMDEAPAPVVVGTPRGPEPMTPYQQAQLARDAQRAPMQDALMRAQIAKAEADAAKAAQGTAGATVGNAATNNRLGAMRAAQNQIETVRDLYQRNFQGGVPNGLVGILPDLARPENGQFDSAGAGLSEAALAAFRVPGVGAQSDAELRAFVSANQPQAGDSDLVIEQKLANIENRIRETMAVMAPSGQPARDEATPAINLGRIQPALNPSGGDGVAPAADGYETVPELVGLGSRLRGMVQARRPEREIVAAYRMAMAQAGREPQADQITALRNATRGGEVEGWENFDRARNQPGDVSALRQITGMIADSDVGNFAMNAANSALAGAPAWAAGNTGVMDAANVERPVSGFVGDMTGSVGAMVGIGKAAGLAGRAGGLFTGAGGIGGDMAYGAARGGFETNGDPMAIALGAGAAGAGNRIGSGITSGVGRIARGVSDPAVRALNDRGIRMTPGQMLGGGGQRGLFGRGYRAVENALESVPFIGQSISTRRMDGIADYNRATLTDALAPIGGQVQGEIGQEAIGNAQQTVSDAYNVLQGRTFAPDQQFVSELTPALQSGRSIPRVGEEFGAIMDRQIGPMFGQEGDLAGNAFQDALQTLRGARSSFNRDGAMGSMAADATSDVEGALTGLVRRQAPDVMPQLDAANSAFRNIQPIENASLTAVNQGGVFTPAQYGRAAVNNTKKFGGSHAAARGDYPGAELQQAAQDVLPSIVPNSGTADRAWASMVLPGALGGTAALGGATGTIDPATGLSIATLAALTSRGGSAAAQRALTARPETMIRAGNGLVNNRRYGGMFGAGFAPSLALGLYQPQ